MRKWNAPAIEELMVNKTSQGGTNENNRDGWWTDQYDNLWASYSGEGDLGGPDIDVEKK